VQNLQVSHPTSICTYKNSIVLTVNREDEVFIKKHGKRKAFHKGENSSCRSHMRQHYDIYKERCEKAGVPVNHWVIPRDIWKKMEEEKEEEKRGRLSKKAVQQQLNFQAVVGPYTEFTRAGTLHAVTQLIAVNNQVSCCFVEHPNVAELT